MDLQMLTASVVVRRECVFLLLLPQAGRVADLGLGLGILVISRV